MKDANDANLCKLNQDSKVKSSHKLPQPSFFLHLNSLAIVKCTKVRAEIQHAKVSKA